MNIIFFGTSHFAVPALEALLRAGIRPALVVTTPDAPRGRKQILSPSPVKAKALELGLDIFQPQTLKDPAVLARITSIKPDVGVLAAYGKIIPGSLIHVFPKGILNIHPSLLPRWRGPTPIQATILAGDKKAGVTIILMDEKIDHGPILAQRELEMTNCRIQMANIDYVALHDNLAELGAEMIPDILPKWIADKVSPTPQDHTRATFCKKFSREDAKIDWSRSAWEIDRMVRALNPEPGTWTTWSLGKARDKQATNGKQQILKILSVQPLTSSFTLSREGVNEKCDEPSKFQFGHVKKSDTQTSYQHPQVRKDIEINKANRVGEARGHERAIIFQHSAECENVIKGKIGEVREHNSKPLVKCGTAALILDIVQPEGKKPMPGAEWLRGHKVKKFKAMGVELP